ncbi:MAG: hypothetical protein QG659_679 [Patescibacteria group bacterium]|jgi:hypothetical protein|nr:hypothetical protein [Patescibacteria group bacterium]
MYLHVRSTGPGVSLMEPLGLAVRVAHQGIETMQLGTANPEQSKHPRVLRNLWVKKVGGAGSCDLRALAGHPVSAPTTHLTLYILQA